MNKLLLEFETDINDLYRAYRLSQFSLYVTWGLFRRAKNSNVNLENLILESAGILPEMSYSEEELTNYTGENGKYQRIVVGSTIVMFYSIWEDNYRGKLAKVVGLKNNDIKSDLFGELGKIRHSITHNNYKPIDDLKKLEILKYIVHGKELFLSCNELEKIRIAIIEEIKNLDKKYCN